MLLAFKYRSSNIESGERHWNIEQIEMRKNYRKLRSGIDRRRRDQRNTGMTSHTQRMIFHDRQPRRTDSWRGVAARDMQGTGCFVIKCCKKRVERVV
jgi:hypothetical protein